MRGPVRLRGLALSCAVTVVVLAGAACQPVVNPPAGGGQVVTGTYRIGPFNLAAEGQPGDQSNSGANIPRPSGPFGIKAMRLDIVDASGNPVPHPDVHLHHVVMMNNARQSQYCPTWPERFWGSGSERTPFDMPDPYAYLVGANDRWSAIWHIMNTSTQARQVYIEYEIEYQPGATSANTRGVTPFFLDVTGCGNSEYDVPGNGGPGSLHSQTRTWSVPWNGMLVGAGGHQHEGGVDIALRDETNGSQCVMESLYDHDHGHGAPTQIETCPVHVRVTAGQRFSVVSRYDNSEPHPDSMGIVMAYAWQGAQ